MVAYHFIRALDKSVQPFGVSLDSVRSTGKVAPLLKPGETRNLFLRKRKCAFDVLADVKHEM